MTADDLQAIVRVLSNNTFCRYWWDWRILDPDTATMVIAAIEIDQAGRAKFVEVPDLDRHGFTKVVMDKAIYYAIARTDQDGKPWVASFKH